MLTFKAMDNTGFSLLNIPLCSWFFYKAMDETVMRKLRKLQHSDAEWQQILTPEQFSVCRKKSTEAPFSGQYNHFDESGVYHCVCCHAPLFSSVHKYDSGSGWPSFWRTLQTSAIIEQQDDSYGMQRIEIICAGCDAHLGHLFIDGPDPTGLRYCVNSLALNFVKVQVE